METIWTKAVYRDPKRREPIFRDGDTSVSTVGFVDAVATLRESARELIADVLLAEDREGNGTRLHPFPSQPWSVERQWSLFGLRMGDGDDLELWLREYRLALLRTYRWNDFVFEPLGIAYGDIAVRWPIPLNGIKTVDLREDLL